MLESYCRLGVQGDKCDKPFRYRHRHLYVRKKALDSLRALDPPPADLAALVVAFNAFDNEAVAAYIENELAVLAPHFDSEDAEREWLKEADILYWRLVATTVHCHEAAVIVRKYAPGSSDLHPYAEGCEAMHELEALACGYGPGGESMEGNLTRLFNMDPSETSIQGLITEHFELVQRVNKNPDISIDTIMKHSLLRYIREHPDFASVHVAEEACAAKEVDYKTTVLRLKETLARKSAHSAGVTAFYVDRSPDRDRDREGGRRSKPKPKVPKKTDANTHCFKCGRTGVRSNESHDCNIEGTHKKHAAFDRDRALRILGRPVAGTTIPSMLARSEQPTNWQEQASQLQARLHALEAVTSLSGSQASGGDSPAPLSGGWAAIVSMDGMPEGGRYPHEVLDALPSSVPGVMSGLSAAAVGHLDSGLLASLVFTAVLDSGATMHMVNDRRLFGAIDCATAVSRVRIEGISGHLSASGIGAVPLSFYDSSAEKTIRIDLHNCLYVPSLPRNLISVSQLLAADFEVNFKSHLVSILVPVPRASHHTITSKVENGLFQLKFSSRVADQYGLMAGGPAIAASTSSSATPAVWHQRFAHSQLTHNLNVLRAHVRDLHVTRTAPPVDISKCETCCLHKAKRRHHGDIHGTMLSTGPHQLVHVDGASLSGMPRSRENFAGFYLFVDDYDSTIFVAGYTQKSHALQCYQAYIAWVRSTLPSRSGSGGTVQFHVVFKSDYAGELSAGNVKRFLESGGHGRMHSSPHAPEENSVAERAVQTVKSFGKVIFADAKFRPDMWFLSIQMAAFILMLLPATRNGGVTPYERRWNATPTIAFLRAPGCKVYYYNYTAGKINFNEPRAKVGVLVGYDLHSRVYKILSMQSNRIVRSSDCSFDESVFPLGSTLARTPMAVTDEAAAGSLRLGQTDGDRPLQTRLRDECDEEDDVIQSVLVPPTIDPAILPDGDAADEAGLGEPPQDWTGERFEPHDRPQGSTRSGAAFRGLLAHDEVLDITMLPRVLHALACFAGSEETAGCEFQRPDEAEYAYAFRIKTGINTVFGAYEPGSYKDAMTCVDFASWMQSMANEWHALERLGAFELVPAISVPKQFKIISSMWVYKVKPPPSNGEEVKRKSRLVIRGFLQDTAGLNTFAPTVKMVTLRVLVALSTFLGWRLHQMDVCNAFLNASLPDGNTYMKLPEGYEKEGMVVRLKKALYGLKNSPREWNIELTGHLMRIGLVRSVLDACLFIKVVDGMVVLILAIHVDDIIITGVGDEITWVVEKMKEAFQMDDMGEPSRILGMDIVYDEDLRITTLHQASYIDKMLHRFNGDKLFKTRMTPMEQGCKLSKDDEEKDESAISFPYRELVASLLYLSICTRPDIAFTVKELSRFLNNPGKRMIAVAVRCLHYVATFKSFGLRFHHGLRKVAGAFYYTGAPVTAYSDASFADRDDRKSTAGVLLLFNGTAIMWSSKTLKTIACSSQDAELMALSDCSREIVFLQNLLDSIGYSIPKVRLRGDNMGSLFVAENPANHQKTKHIEVRYFFVRQKVEEGRIVLSFVPTAEQQADFLTKALGKFLHRALTASAMGYDEFPEIEMAGLQSASLAVPPSSGAPSLRFQPRVIARRNSIGFASYDGFYNHLNADGF